MKKFLVLIIIVSNILFGEQNTEQINSGEKITKVSIEKLEKQVEDWERRYSLDLKEIDNKYQEKLNEIINEKEQIKLEKDEIIRNYNSLTFIVEKVGIGSLISIIALLISAILYLFSLWKSIDKKVKKKVIEKISDITDIEKENFTKILKIYDEELKLKRTKKICVLSIDNKNKGEISKILNGFEQNEYKNIETNIDYKNYDLILINHNGEYSMDKINNLITENSNSYFFYYGSGRVNSINKKMNFSNSIFTLYGNLIDLLRTQDLLSR